MIKAKKHNSSTKMDLFVFGLSYVNLQKLKEGMPIHFVFEGKEFLICAGETEDTIAEELKPLIGETTQVIDTRGTKKH